MCRSVIAAFALTGDDHSLLILPLFHVNGIVVSTLSPLLAGGRATSRALQPDDVLRPSRAERRDLLLGRPDDLHDAVRPAGRRRPTPPRCASRSAAPRPPRRADRARSKPAYGVPLIEGYGLSEGTCASTVNPLRRHAQARHRRAAAARADGPGRSTPTGNRRADGEAGEVVIQGPNVMRGYLNRPEETAKTIVDGWLHTGDVGRFDEDGYLVLVDRTKDMIIRGGENIYPKEIEAVVTSCRRSPRPPSSAARTRSTARSRCCSSRCTPARGSTWTRSANTSASAVEIQTAGGYHGPRRPSQERGRQDRQARLRRLSTSAVTPEHDPTPTSTQKENDMGFTKPDFPTSIRRFLPKPLMERMRILALNWAENGFGSPKMVHTVYIAKLVFFYALGGVVVATRPRGCPRSGMSPSGGTSRSSTRRPSCGRCCWKRSVWPGPGARWPARSSR